MIPVLVTGGGGFVGGNFVRLALRERPEWKITVVDRMGGRDTTPALEGLKERYSKRFRLVRMDLQDSGLGRLFDEERFRYILHFAAKNPSGKDIGSPFDFAEINVERTVRLLEEVRRTAGQGTRFVHLSSYEVYGSHRDKPFTEDDPLDPTTPYAASKASADLFSFAYRATFGLDVVSTRTTNIYGPYQSGDKLIPMIIKRAAAGEPIPVYGDGSVVRDWIFVEDHNLGVLKVLEEGKPGGVYHIGASCEKSQNEVIGEALRNVARITGKSYEDLSGLVSFGQGRPTEDERRTLDASKMATELAFRPRYSFEEGMGLTAVHFLGEGA